MGEEVIIKDVIKHYGKNLIIPGLSAEIRGGEMFTLLGPSGCGKTTLLRMIAGFERIEGGTVSLGSKVINNVPPHKRNIGMVFQEYALFPHMTVEENIRYGLKFRSITREETDRRVKDILRVARIEEYRDRLPEQLSGGQQQRVALARAIVVRPRLLLMDEPLSNLDAKLRCEMRSAIREIQKSSGITTIYVTHDQEEALAISDRIAVMRDGMILQTGTPERMYYRPADMFTAGFIGHTNFFRVIVRGQSIRFSEGHEVMLEGLKEGYCGEAIAGIRTEGFCMSTENSPTGTLRAKIIKKTFMGRWTSYRLHIHGCTPFVGRFVEVSPDTELSFKEGDSVDLTLRRELINVYEPSGRSLMKEAMQ